MGMATDESWQAYHRRMLRETERFIEWGLAHPNEAIPIPVKPAEEGGFPAQVGLWFWNTVLSLRPTGRMRRWREHFRRRPRGIMRRPSRPARRAGRLWR
jgi:hypothetical protein